MNTRKAHLYQLTINFQLGMVWNIQIIAVNTNAVGMWISDVLDIGENYITEANIKLIQRDYEDVNPLFVARVKEEDE